MGAGAGTGMNLARGCACPGAGGGHARRRGVLLQDAWLADWKSSLRRKHSPDVCACPPTASFSIGSDAASGGTRMNSARGCPCPGAGVCRQAQAGCRSAGGIRVSEAQDGNPVRHSGCSVVFCESGSSKPTGREAAGRPGARLGATRAPSPDVCVGHRARRSLHVRCASPSWLRLLPQPGSGARAAPR
jgi:hypothetical protein